MARTRRSGAGAARRRRPRRPAPVRRGPSLHCRAGTRSQCRGAAAVPTTRGRRRRRPTLLVRAGRGRPCAPAGEDGAFSADVCPSPERAAPAGRSALERALPARCAARALRFGRPVRSARAGPSGSALLASRSTGDDERRPRRPAGSRAPPRAAATPCRRGAGSPGSRCRSHREARCARGFRPGAVRAPEAERCSRPKGLPSATRRKRHRPRSRPQRPLLPPPTASDVAATAVRRPAPAERHRRVGLAAWSSSPESPSVQPPGRSSSAAAGGPPGDRDADEADRAAEEGQGGGRLAEQGPADQDRDRRHQIRG